MAKRKSLPKKLRFEVLKRDKFQCQYCGAKAPDVLLQIDHIQPVAAGGLDDVLNLITSCDGCNSGKSDRKLSDATAVSVARAQAAELQTRREQIEMMAQWQTGLLDLEQQQLSAAHDVIKRMMPGRQLTDETLSELRTHLRKYGMEAVLSQFRASFAQSVRVKDGAQDAESIGVAVRSALNTLKWKEANERDPVGSKARYIRGILRNRLRYVNERLAVDYASNAIEEGIDANLLIDMAKRATSWSSWENEIVDLILEARKEPRG